MCTKEQYIKEFKTWTDENEEIDKFIQELRINNNYDFSGGFRNGYRGAFLFQWIPYDNFSRTVYIAYRGYCTVYSAALEDGIKDYWDIKEQSWQYNRNLKAYCLKEIGDSRNDISRFFEEVCIILYLDGKLM